MQLLGAWGPGRRGYSPAFRPDLPRQVVLEKMQELSGNFKYRAQVGSLSCLLAGFIIAPRFRYIVNISLMEKKGAGFHTRPMK